MFAIDQVCCYIVVSVTSNSVLRALTTQDTHNGALLCCRRCLEFLVDYSRVWHWIDMVTAAKFCDFDCRQFLLLLSDRLIAKDLLAR